MVVIYMILSKRLFIGVIFFYLVKGNKLLYTFIKVESDFMKDNKVNVDLIVPSIGERFNLFIPVNKTVGEVIVILNKSINEMTGYFPQNRNLSILDVNENKIYDYNQEFINTGVKNGSVLALI